ncbi:MAG: hypothetical protein ACI85Q_001638 [Salibacteraceae bacterium]|jgi:uncharacterized protein YbcC (UPF0753/DUF2309 family)
MTTNIHSQAKPLIDTLRTACKKIAPVWPLENFVAVNPYLGMTDQKFADVAIDLAVAGDIRMTLPYEFYLEKINTGELTHDAMAIALKKHNQSEEVDAFLNSVSLQNTQPHQEKRIPTIADVASQLTQKDWNRFITARITNWATSYFDSKQAIWAIANKEESPFTAWKEVAKVDLTTEIAGLTGFRKIVNSLPTQPLAAAQMAIEKLDIPEEGLDIYLHSLLVRMGGWSAYTAQLDWDNVLYGKKDGKVIEFLTILLCWEMCLLECIKTSGLAEEWMEAKKTLANVHITKQQNLPLIQKLVLQDAFDLSAQQNIINKFTGSVTKLEKIQPKVQAIFCIDVRSEVYRRNLERVDSEIHTMGFAGFFAFSINYVPLGHNTGEANCPVLLKTGYTIKEEISDTKKNKTAIDQRILHRQIQQVWKSFKSGAVSCFSFVSPLGLSYLPKLFTDSFGWTRPVPHPKKVGLKSTFYSQMGVHISSEIINGQISGIPIGEQINLAKNALTAMSLTRNFGKLVLIVGHGSTMVNNLHATGYDCGACGGHTGEANAKVVADVLNNSIVREGLQNAHIHIPENTIFLACLHDTTTDEMRIFNTYDIPNTRIDELNDLNETFKKAGQIARAERSLRLENIPSSNTDKSILARSKDWSQTRPEWGLAGCSAFVIAPRERTQGIDFQGKSFLHSYNWKNDTEFAVLEAIMTAPMVVTSWISLQYYASTVDNKNYGSGNKTLHNVTSGIGVLEGFSGDLRVGLPWQAVHDGNKYQHEPIKLNVIIEAPKEAMNAVLKKHSSVKDLCDNGWLYLLAMGEDGKIAHRYDGDFTWIKIPPVAA